MKQITVIEAVEKQSKKRLRVAAYARVSTANDSQLISIKVQKQHYEQLITSREDWDFAGVYFDEGVSGTKMAKREGLLSMIEDCKKGMIDYILVKSLSRFSRNTVESVETVRMLYDMGVYIFFEKENIDTGKLEGELLLSILSSLAENESRSISENVTWGNLRRFKDGTFIVACPPYGYVNIDGEMRINEKEAPIVREIFLMVIAGNSAEFVAKELNNRGIETKRKKQWLPNTIRGMIRNEKYKGDACFQKTYTDGNFVQHKNNGEKEMFYVSNHHEAIVTAEEFELANSMIKQNAIEKGSDGLMNKPQPRYAFSGKIICSECGFNFKRIKTYNFYSYGCSNHIKSKEKCRMRSINEDVIKAAFCTMMNKLVFAKNTILLPLSNDIRVGGEKRIIDKICKIDEEIESNTQTINNIVQMYSKGYLDLDFFKKQKEDLECHTADLDREKNGLVQELRYESEKRKELDLLIAYTAKNEMTTEFQDELFSKFVDHIVIYDRNTLGFVLKCGPEFRERLK